MWNIHFSEKREPATGSLHAATALFEAMRPDVTARTAAEFLVPRVPTGSAWEVASDAPPKVRQQSYRVESDTVALRVESDGAGYLRLAHPMAATTRVTLDGKPAPAVADIASLIVVAIHPGINDIQVSAAPSPLRGACFAVSAAVWLVLLAWLGIAAFRCELSARPSPV